MFFSALHGREQDRGSRSTRKHTAAAQTHGLQVCADVACSCCSCSAGSTRVLGVAVLRVLRISIARLRPALGPLPGGRTNTFLPSTHHNIERLQALWVLLRSGSIGLGLTFLARLMVVLRAARGRGIFEVASDKRDEKREGRDRPALRSQQCTAAKHVHALTRQISEFLHLPWDIYASVEGLSDSNLTPTHPSVAKIHQYFFARAHL